MAICQPKGCFLESSIQETPIRYVDSKLYVSEGYEEHKFIIHFGDPCEIFRLFTHSKHGAKIAVDHCNNILHTNIMQGILAFSELNNHTNPYRSQHSIMTANIVNRTNEQSVPSANRGNVQTYMEPYSPFKKPEWIQLPANNQGGTRYDGVGHVIQKRGITDMIIGSVATYLIDKTVTSFFPHGDSKLMSHKLDQEMKKIHDRLNT